MKSPTVRPYLGENPECASGHMSGAVVDLVCTDQRSRGFRAWQARLRHPAGKLLGDCDLMRSTSASRTRQRWSGNARSATSVKRAAGTALSVIVVLFDHHESLRNHRDTSTLEQYPILSCTISVMPRETLKHTARGSAHASEPKSRRKVHVENVHEVELPKDPVIVVGGGELVARELAAREHHPAAETTAAPSRTRSDRGRT